MDQEAVNHKTLIYGADFCRHAIVVVEGPLDTWAIGPGAGALCGTGFTRAQVLAISRFPVRAICFDALPDAQKTARELCNLLRVLPGETYNVVLDSKDPGEALTTNPRELRQLRKHFLDN